MKNFYFFTFILFCIFISFLNSTIINIPADQPTIQQGINASVDSDTVLVQPDTYFENINYNGKNITVASLFLTTQDTSYISQTIIDGNDVGSVVTFESGEDSTAILCGFTITNGNAERGGGIYCYQTNPLLKNLKIQENIASGDFPSGMGGGIYCRNSSNLILEDVTISYNSALGSGGGIYCSHSSMTIENATVNNNSASESGGGIRSVLSYLEMENVTITENFAFEVGGGLYLSHTDSLSFSNESRCNIFMNSISGDRILGKEIYYYNPDNYDITFNVIVDTFTVITPTD